MITGQRRDPDDAKRRSDSLLSPRMPLEPYKDVLASTSDGDWVGLFYALKQRCNDGFPDVPPAIDVEGREPLRVVLDERFEERHDLWEAKKAALEAERQRRGNPPF